MKGEGLSEK